MSAMTRWIAWSAAAIVLVAGGLNAVQAEEISHDKLMHMIQTAKSRADHEAIASVYEQQANADRAAAENHRRMEGLYKGIDPTAGGRGSGQMAVHCKNIATGYARAAEEHDALAKLHRQAAAEAK